MKIERKAIETLKAWRNRKSHKPLILQGARQVGKTWLLKEFGKSNFDDVAIFNFDENPELKQFFGSTKDVKRIIEKPVFGPRQNNTSRDYAHCFR
jgi:predicted AAA+ superfamily ATPase